MVNTFKPYYLLHKAAQLVLSSTCQFHQIKAGKIELSEAVGCGVLIQINNNFYCLSNSHVFENRHKNYPFIYLKDNCSITLGGVSYSTKLPTTQNRNDDTIDISLFKVSNENADSLMRSGKTFLSYSSIKVDFSPSVNDIIMIAGYPGSKTKSNPRTRMVTASPLVGLTKLLTKDLSKLGYTKALHYYSAFTRNKALNLETGEFIKTVIPHGMSGSGLWLISLGPNNQLQVNLLGILSEYLENRSIMLSTKVGVFIDLIRQKYDPTIPLNDIRLEINTF